MKYQTSNQGGFSLVETLVAITILLLVIVGPMTISVTTAKSTSYASEQVLAFFLAQEGVELVQKVRDDALLKRFVDSTDQDYEADPWEDLMNESTGILEDCYKNAGCALYFEANNKVKFEPCDPATECDLYYKEDTDPDDDVLELRSRYTHNSEDATPQPFSRVIKLTSILEGADVVGVKVESTVSWRTGNQRALQNVKVETYLYDIYGPAT